MKKYEFTTIGTFHTDHNEDFLVTAEMGDDKLLIAVMDGCSMGTESYFASGLVGKILRKAAKEWGFWAFIEKKEAELAIYLRDITRNLFDELLFFKNKLMLENTEILTTLILGVVDCSQKKAELIAIGDGLICCNGIYTEYEQDNRPDYLGYHLTEDFETWYTQQKQKLSLDNISDLAISTDGIFTFKKFDTAIYPTISEKELVDFLLINSNFAVSETMLKKKIYHIEKEFGLKTSDDLSIVRLIF
jgi:Protein phosphatase 2C